MDKKTFLEKIQEIGTCEDDVTRRSLLAEVNEGVSGVFDQNEELASSNSSLTEDNEKLRSANMDLFLQIGQPKSPEDLTKGSTGLTPPQEKRKFENLFNEKGEIK